MLSGKIQHHPDLPLSPAVLHAMYIMCMYLDCLCLLSTCFLPLLSYLSCPQPLHFSWMHPWQVVGRICREEHVDACPGFLWVSSGWESSTEGAPQHSSCCGHGPAEGSGAAHRAPPCFLCTLQCGRQVLALPFTICLLLSGNSKGCSKAWMQVRSPVLPFLPDLPELPAWTAGRILSGGQRVPAPSSGCWFCWAQPCLVFLPFPNWSRLQHPARGSGTFLRAWGQSGRESHELPPGTPSPLLELGLHAALAPPRYGDLHWVWRGAPWGWGWLGSSIRPEPWLCSSTAVVRIGNLLLCSGRELWCWQLTSAFWVLPARVSAAAVSSVCCSW